MDIDKRLAETQEKFDKLKVQRENLLNQAAEMLTEMNRLQGEYRVLNDLSGKDKVEIPDEADNTQEGGETPQVKIEGEPSDE